MPVYTRKGDEGETYLADGSKVGKDHIRVELYGALDELNCILGLAAAYLKEEESKDLYGELCSQQHLLFEWGAELAAYQKKASQGEAIRSEDTQNLEKSMDRMELALGRMQNFILPGGTLSSAALHWARSLCRRLERQMTNIMRDYKNQDEKQKMIVHKEAYRYINRLSDYLFMAARYANFMAGCSDTAWQKRD